MTTTPAAAPVWPVWVGIGVYTVVRLALVPADPEVVPGYTHDSGYIAIVAGNLAAGRGFVNDAHWLVFLQPESLPVPYHNANPLYPTVVAALMVAGCDAVWAGLAVSAVASGLLFAAVFVLAGTCADHIWQRVALAAAVTFFPPVFHDSFHMLPDALCTALLAWSAVCLFRRPGAGGAAAAGLLFGLAWLTRASAVLALPAAVVFFLARGGWRAALRPAAVFGGVAALAALPWLIYTAAVWSSPLRSDAGYYLWQDYHAFRQHTDIEHFWHSPEPPPPLGEVIREDPSGFAGFLAEGVPILLLSLAAGWTEGSHAAAALLAALVAACACQLRGTVKATPEVLALAVFALTTLAAYVPRARSMELRYAEGVSALLGFVLMLAVVRLPSWRALRRPATAAAVGLSALWWLAWTPYADARAWLLLHNPDPQRQALREVYREVNDRFARGGPVVVGNYPYHYTRYTGAPALSIPAADDAFFYAYMDCYGARWVVLTDAEREHWRPQWSGRLPAWLRPVARLRQVTVFERVE
jgi:hypothetical protein